MCGGGGGISGLGYPFPLANFPERGHSAPLIFRAGLWHLHGTNNSEAFTSVNLQSTDRTPYCLLWCSDGNRRLKASYAVDKGKVLGTPIKKLQFNFKRLLCECKEQNETEMILFYQLIIIKLDVSN